MFPVSFSPPAPPLAINPALLGAGVLASGILAIVLTIRARLKLHGTTDKLGDRVTELRQQLAECERNRDLLACENQILSEFVSNTEIQRGLSGLLRRLVPRPDQGLCLLAELENDGSSTLKLNRGLSESSVRQLQLDRDWRTRVRPGEVRELDPGELHRSQFYESLHATDRRKLSRVFLAGIGRDRLVGYLLTTALYPVGMDRAEQFELTGRLMDCLAGQLLQIRTMHSTADKLTNTKAILAIRSVADGVFRTKGNLLTAVLDKALELTKFSRGFLVSLPVEQKPVVRAGVTHPPHREDAWRKQEGKLLTHAMAQAEIELLDREALSEIGIETLVGSAMLIPMRPTPTESAMLLLTRAELDEISQDARDLGGWLGKFLGDLMVKATNQEEMAKRARTDGLTGLANRATFDEVLEGVCETAVKTRIDSSLVLIDLDHFKSVNDRFGHQVGDQVLKTVSDILREQSQQMRASDRVLLARYGGEELAVILPDVPCSGAMRIADGIRVAIEQAEIFSGEDRVSVTASLGIATVPQHARTSGGLIAAADAALYRAKHSGRNCVVVGETANPATLPVQV